LNDSDLNDSADGFFLYSCCGGDESDEDDDSMRNAEIDRDDDSMNDLSEVDRCGFFRKRDFSERIHLAVD
jgi:hypothetical protein